MSRYRSRSFSFVNTSGDGDPEKFLTTLTKDEKVMNLIAGKIQDEDDSKVTWVGKIRFLNALTPSSMITKLFPGKQIQGSFREEQQDLGYIFSVERIVPGKETKESIGTLTVLSGVFNQQFPEMEDDVNPVIDYINPNNSSPKGNLNLQERSQKIQEVLSNRCVCLNHAFRYDFRTTIENPNSLRLAFSQVTANPNTKVDRKVYWLSGRSVYMLNEKAREILEENQIDPNWLFYEHVGTWQKETTLPQYKGQEMDLFPNLNHQLFPDSMILSLFGP
jgi:hypothetical protein